MTNSLTSRACSPVPWWLAPAAAAVLLAGAVGWAYRAAPDDPPPPKVDDAWGAQWRGGRVLPRPPETDASPARWSGIESGRRVVYVQAVPGGDIVVVDAENGRMIEVRPPVKPK